MKNRTVEEEILFCVLCSKVRPDKRTLAKDAWAKERRAGSMRKSPAPEYRLLLKFDRPWAMPGGWDVVPNRRNTNMVFILSYFTTTVSCCRSFGDAMWHLPRLRWNFDFFVWWNKLIPCLGDQAESKVHPVSVQCSIYWVGFLFQIKRERHFWILFVFSMYKCAVVGTLWYQKKHCIKISFNRWPQKCQDVQKYKFMRLKKM